jgi:hypothetical protein
LWPIWQGRFDDALKIQENLHGTFRRGSFIFLMNSYVEAFARGGKGEYEQALALLEELMAAAKRMGDVWWLARTLNTMGWLCGELQDYPQAMTWNTQGVEAVQKAKFPNLEIENNSRLNLGTTCWLWADCTRQISNSRRSSRSCATHGRKTNGCSGGTHSTYSTATVSYGLPEGTWIRL